MAEYSSVIVVKKSSSIKKMKDLKGRLVGMKSIYSSSGYLMPKYTLSEAGLRTKELKSINADRDPNEVSYTFTNSNISSMLWLSRGRVDAAAMSYEKYAEYAAKNASEFRIITLTDAVPRHVLCASKNLPVQHLQSVTDLMKKMHLDKEGLKVLKTFSKTTKFDDLPQGFQANMKRYEEFFKREIGSDK